MQQNAPILYNDPILTERLFPPLQEIDETAHQRLVIQRELLQNDPAPDKATDQMAWVQHMNSIKAQAEESILTELIYAWKKPGLSLMISPAFCGITNSESSKLRWNTTDISTTE